MDNTTASENLTALVHELQSELRQLQETIAAGSANENAFFLVSMAVIIFFMQAGFAFLEAGAVRSKNTVNILINNLLDSCISIAGYWAVGWALAYGYAEEDGIGRLVGHSNFFLSGNFHDYSKFFFQFVFAATAATIVSGAVAERCQFSTYLTYSFWISSIIYPIITHWAWTEPGWMKHGITSGSIHTTYLDFAGSGCVHLTGGSISLLAAWMIGPRIGRYESANGEASIELKGHSVPFAALGGFILMFGFLAFNGGSMADIVHPGEGSIIALAMVNTMVSGAFAAFTYLVIHYFRHNNLTFLLTLNALLAGEVAICAGCNLLKPWAAALTGIGAGVMYLALTQFTFAWRIDDPLDAFAVHFGGGLWGLIAVALFKPDGFFYALADTIGGSKGASHRLGQASAQLGWQAVCALAIIAWSVLMMAPLFWVLKKIGLFRVSREVEINGLDIFKHGEAAYPLVAYGHGWDEYDHVEEEEEKGIDDKIEKESSIAGVRPRRMTVGERAMGVRRPSQHRPSHTLELSLEEMAAVLAHSEPHQTSTSQGQQQSPLQQQQQQKKSTCYSPHYFEHPEHHQKARLKKPVANATKNGALPRSAAQPVVHISTRWLSSPSPSIKTNSTTVNDEHM